MEKWLMNCGQCHNPTKPHEGLVDQRDDLTLMYYCEVCHNNWTKRIENPFSTMTSIPRF